MILQEPKKISVFKRWLQHHGGGFHPHAKFVEGPHGFSIRAEEDIPVDATIVSCPFDLAISRTSVQQALNYILNLTGTQGWSERQWISTYICMHWMFSEECMPPSLQHFPYINTLPNPQHLLTPLHFTEVELEAFRGSNIYGATLERRAQWKSEWSNCTEIIRRTNPAWESLFTWLVSLLWSTVHNVENYLTAATYISSRAFPSSLLSQNPTLAPSSSTGPVLLPGVDSLNHARAQPVSWVVTHSTVTITDGSAQCPTISLVLHTSTSSGRELLNNYGPKPNSELILGYGFSLPNNPDDTIILKVGGIEGKKWEVGREARGTEDLWSHILQSMMVQNLLERLPGPISSNNKSVHTEVAQMFLNYIEGQRDILYSLMALAQEKENLAIKIAKSQGIDIVLEDE
ncbi:SET domain protein [Cyathus striatus]|nr:SET domain protein [Cyathus striatus]